MGPPQVAHRAGSCLRVGPKTLAGTRCSSLTGSRKRARLPAEVLARPGSVMPERSLREALILRAMGCFVQLCRDGEGDEE